MGATQRQGLGMGGTSARPGSARGGMLGPPVGGVAGAMAMTAPGGGRARPMSAPRNRPMGATGGSPADARVSLAGMMMMGGSLVTIYPNMLACEPPPA